MSAIKRDGPGMRDSGANCQIAKMRRGGVPTIVPHADLSSAFTQVLPSAAIITDVEARQIAASDIAFEALHLPACILAPKNEEEVAAIVSVARAEGISLYPRGGGWSYTKAHLP
jgi:FAD binding domain-containing protein